jgi:excisionase family DNA binding protein
MVGKRRVTPEQGTEFLTVGEAAVRLGVTPATLRNWDKAGKLKAHRHPINRYRIYRIDDIEALKNAIHSFES